MLTLTLSPTKVFSLVEAPGIAVLLGGIAGTTLGIKWRPPMILKALGVVLIIAGLKLVGVY
jgi:hypothetical protein